MPVLKIFYQQCKQNCCSVFFIGYSFLGFISERLRQDEFDFFGCTVEALGNIIVSLICTELI